MKKKNISRLIIALILTTIMAYGATSFAGWGMGYGSRGGHHGPGWNQRGWDGRGGWGNDLSDEEIEKLEEQRQAFLKDTEGLRQDLYSKGLELRSVLVKPEPDQKRALTVQNEILGLRAQLDQKRIGHMIEMKKINPHAGRGYAEGGGRGLGHGGRDGFGKGYGPGNCWR